MNVVGNLGGPHRLPAQFECKKAVFRGQVAVKARLARSLHSWTKAANGRAEVAGKSVICVSPPI